MPRKKWTPTEAYLKRNKWLNRTAGKAARRLQANHYEEYRKILAQVRKQYPYEESTDEKDKTSS